MLILAHNNDFVNILDTHKCKLEADVLEAVLQLEKTGLIKLDTLMDENLRCYKKLEPVRQLQISLMP